MEKWAYIENVAILAVMAFLVWATGSGWWVLLLLLANYQRAK